MNAPATPRTPLDVILAGLDNPDLRLYNFEELVGKTITWADRPYGPDAGDVNRVIVTECGSWMKLIAAADGDGYSYITHGGSFDVEKLSTILAPDQLVSAGFIHELQTKYLHERNDELQRQKTAKELREAQEEVERLQESLGGRAK